MSQDIEYLLDLAKKEIFIHRHAAFYTSLWCSMQFQWDLSEPTAATDGESIFMNPQWFLQAAPSLRADALLHELDHVARLHMLRQGTRDTEMWNIACDIRINNDRIREGAKFEGFTPYYDLNLDIPSVLSEEEIYEQIQQKKIKVSGPQAGGHLQGDLRSAKGKQVDQAKINRIVGNVIRAVQTAELSAAGMPGKIRHMIDEFLKPVIPWEKELMEFFTEKMTEDYTWRRPNRRSQDIYLPSRFQDGGKLEKLMYFLDVSGSISMKDIIRFNSEVKYIQEVLRPDELWLIQFDAQIQKEDKFEAGDEFTGIEIVGRGGTRWAPVRRYIDEHQPTAAVIFTDLGFMDTVNPLMSSTPVLWVVTGRTDDVEGPFGRTTHIVE